MSYQDYIAARELVAQDQPFYGLVMAAMMRADSDNKVRLQTVFPWVWAELVKRYDAPGALFPGEKPPAVSTGEDEDETDREPSDRQLLRDIGDVPRTPFSMLDKDNPERYNG